MTSRRYLLSRKAFVIFVSVLGPSVSLSVIGAVNTQESSEFPQPQVIQSSNGLLKYKLVVQMARNSIRDQTGEIIDIMTPTYAGTIPGPTMRVKPGDKLEIELVNQLPPNPKAGRMGAFPHHQYTTNLHTHGLKVSPQGISDNIFRQMDPGTTNLISIKIPQSHDSGTFFYHPHQHGAATYQFFGGMSGFLLVDGGRGTLDQVPEVKAAKDVVMAFQAIRTDAQGRVPWVFQRSTSMGTNPYFTKQPAGIWSKTGKPGSRNFVTTNGFTNPTLYMRPGEVQRWRMLAAGSGEVFPIVLQGHRLHIIANDGISIPEMRTLEPEDPYVMGSGQRADVLVKAGKPGTYLLMALDPVNSPATGNSPSGWNGWSVISGSGIAPAPRFARISFDTQTVYPITLATIVVQGDPVNMRLPQGALPSPLGLPSIAKMVSVQPDVKRKVAFEICGNQQEHPPTHAIPMRNAAFRLPSCGWFYQHYDNAYWGGQSFNTLLMMRDAWDMGIPTSNPQLPRVDYWKAGLFTADEPLFGKPKPMIAGNFEEWTVINRTFSDHTFHIHQNPFLVTHINGIRLPVPEWHDTITVPAAQPQPTGLTTQYPVNINTVPHGSITFRTYYDPVTVGAYVMHCHMLQHEDLGMMQRVDLLPR